MAEMTAFAPGVQSAPLTPGMHFDVPEHVYHADPAPEPSLSASGGKILLNRSPRAFAWQHPRLRPASAPPREPESWSDATTFGTVVHKLALGRGKDVVEVDAADWRTNAAKVERADIMAVGKVPILTHRLAEAKAIAQHLRPHVEALGPAQTEVVIIWQDAATDGTPVWCRAMIDLLTEAGMIADLKITGAELTEGFVKRQVGAMAYDFSMAWYRRAVSAVVPDMAGRLRPRLIFAERGEPFDVFNLDLTEGNLHVADRQVQAAIDRFASCMARGRWPGVCPSPRSLDLPDWHQCDFLTAELEGDMA